MSNTKKPSSKKIRKALGEVVNSKEYQKYAKEQDFHFDDLFGALKGQIDGKKVFEEMKQEEKEDERKLEEI